MPARLRTLLAAFAPALALLAVAAGFGLADWWADGESTFLSLRNLRSMIANSLPVAVAALGMTAIIAAGGIDLSAGTMLALCAVVLAVVPEGGGGRAGSRSPRRCSAGRRAGRSTAG